MINIYMAIGLGGALGAMSRFALSRILPATVLFIIPFQIFLVNALGCFLMGVLVEVSALYWSPSPTLRAFLATGFLGGFTTFSAFALEFGLLVDKNMYTHALAYASISVIVSILCFFAGLKAMRIFVA